MKGQTCATKIVLNNEIFVKKADIADQFKQCFVNVGFKLASPVSDGDSDLIYIKYIYIYSPSSSFVLSQVAEEQVFHLFSNVSECKTSLYIPNKLLCTSLTALKIYTPYSKMAANKLFFCLHVN